MHVRILSWEDPWRRKWQPTLVLLLGEFHRQRSLAGYSHGVANSQAFLSTCTHTRVIITSTPDFVALQPPNHVPLLETPWIAAYQASVSLTISWGLPKFMFIESVMPSKHLILCLLPSIRVFSNESVVCLRWPKYWSFRFSISPSNEYSGLISFKTGLVWTACCPRDSQESSVAPQFKSINFSDINMLK